MRQSDTNSMLTESQDHPEETGISSTSTFCDYALHIDITWNEHIICVLYLSALTSAMAPVCDHLENMSFIWQIKKLSIYFFLLSQTSYCLMSTDAIWKCCSFWVVFKLGLNIFHLQTWVNVACPEEMVSLRGRHHFASWEGCLASF